MRMLLKEQKRQYRHKRIRKKIVGTSERLRLNVHRSSKNMVVQLINDSENKVICGMSYFIKRNKV